MFDVLSSYQEEYISRSIDTQEVDIPVRSKSFFKLILLTFLSLNPAIIYLLKVNKRNTYKKVG